MTRARAGSESPALRPITSKQQQQKRGSDQQPSLQYKRAHAPGGDALRYRPTEDEDENEDEDDDFEPERQPTRRRRAGSESNRKQAEDDRQLDDHTHEALSSIGKKGAAARWRGEHVEISPEEREAMSKIGRKGGHSLGSTGTAGGGGQKRGDQDEDEEDQDQEEDFYEDDIALQKQAGRGSTGQRKAVVRGA